MTKEERVQSIARELMYNRRARRKKIVESLIMLIFSAGVALFWVIKISQAKEMIDTWEGSTAYNTLSLLGPFATILLLALHSLTSQRYSNGTPVGAPVISTMSAIASVVPTFFFGTEVLGLSLGVSILISPIVLLVAVAWIYLSNTSPSSSLGRSGGTMSAAQIHLVRNTMKLGGVDPDKVALAPIQQNVADLSAADWFRVSQVMKLAGIDISRK